MKINFERIYKATKLALLILFSALLISLFWQKLLPTDKISYSHDLSGQGKFIFGFYPVGRIVQGSDWQKIIGEPVYFDVYSPRKFKKAQVSLRYLNNTGLDAKFGLKLNVNDWSFYMIKMNSAQPVFASRGDASSAVSQNFIQNEFIEQTFEFDLAEAERIKNKIRFVVAVPGIEKTNGDLLIDDLRVKFK